MAIGLIMGRLGLPEQQAFESLRQSARSQRMRLEELAAQLLRVHEEAETLFASLQPPQGAAMRVKAARAAASRPGFPALRSAR